ncbi:GNAT family N-acetyltransferase [Rhizosphaericola mali]|uniref:N-acetyltransferase n=1 Tax=Rhizosphaericola mali TaxID=2545455 RepID=A0A5P2G1U5_9BACT|nr:GNAT family N-acetyltransferase [Rhizosphaericola mali]QES89425.1 N-acetyltransferase [Rhizosphaericola mali]
MDNKKIINNTNLMRFEIESDNLLAHLDYRKEGESLAFMHTYVPMQWRGKGVAAELTKEAFEFAKSESKKVKIYCSYVASYVAAHPEYQGFVV